MGKGALVVEVRHCDACAQRLPVDFSPGEKRVCPGCGAPVEDDIPAVSPKGQAPAPRARSETRRVGAPRPRTPGARRAPSSRAAGLGPGAGPTKRERTAAAPRAGPSALVIFGGSALAGVVLAAGAALVLTREKPRRADASPAPKHEATTQPRTPAPVRRQKTPPEADAPAEIADVAAETAPAETAEAPAEMAEAPARPPPHQETSPIPAAPDTTAADQLPAAAFAPAVRDKKAEDDYFARLRQEMADAAARKVKEAEERAARAANMKPIIKKNAQWHYLAGAHPRGEWTRHDYRPLGQLGWKAGTAGFGYGDNDDSTVLKDMCRRYTAVYVRKPFDVPDPGDIKALDLVINYDDGFIAYLNGEEVARSNVPTGSGVKASGMVQHEAGKFERFEINDLGRLLRKGTNVFAIEGHNTRPNSSDFTLDPYLEGVRESASR